MLDTKTYLSAILSMESSTWTALGPKFLLSHDGILTNSTGRCTRGVSQSPPFLKIFLYIIEYEI